MRSVLKAVLACALGLGFALMDIHAKPSVAFLGLSEDSDPLVRDALAEKIRWELAGDSTLFSFSSAEISPLFTKGALKGPWVDPMDLPRLSKQIGAQFYAFGKLEALAWGSKRSWLTPWQVSVNWTQGLRLRVLEGATGKVVYDGVVPSEFTEKALLSGPEPGLARMHPLERDRYIRQMTALLSVESAKALSQVMGGKTPVYGVKPGKAKKKKG
jgi:hypothetical protein